MNITFGICTFNRKEVLMQSIQSLRAVHGVNKIHIRIYDDCSTEYTRKELKALIPEAKSIFDRPRNVGADANTAYMYEEFLKSDDDVLVTADSDLIYRDDVVERIEEYMPRTDGFMSLFNTPIHKTARDNDPFFLEKQSVGAAGCCMTKDTVAFILKNIEDRKDNFDWNFSKLLKDNGIRLLVTKESIVQHIGVLGYNSGGADFDYGLNFQCNSLINAEIIENLLENNMRVLTSMQQYRCVMALTKTLSKDLLEETAVRHLLLKFVEKIKKRQKGKFWSRYCEYIQNKTKKTKPKE